MGFTLAKGRFSFLSLKSQDKSRCLKLFLAQPLAQTPGACEMGGGQRGGTNIGAQKSGTLPTCSRPCGTLPFGWESQHILFSPLVDSQAPWGCGDQHCFRWMTTECSQNYAGFSQIFKPFKCWGFFELPLYPSPHCQKRANLLALYI